MKKSLKITLVCVVSLVMAVAAFFLGTYLQKANNNSFYYDNCLSNIDFGQECYVIGHKSPDTDTVCSAIAYSSLMQKLGINCKPSISGNLNNETKLALNKFGVSSPDVLKNAADKKMILVDHSTYSQGIDGLTEADIIALLDHHSFGDVKTINPPFVTVYPLGACATVVYTLYKDYDIAIDKEIAGLILSAILSDTANLTLDITTDLDRNAVKELSNIAGVNDVDSYFKDLEKALGDYSGMSDVDIFKLDYKEYNMGASKVAISCVNAEDEDSTKDMCTRMEKAMKDCYPNQNMDDLYCMVKNTKDNYTVIVTCGKNAQGYAEKIWGKDTSGKAIINPAASRKKDVVPKLLAIYEGK